MDPSARHILAVYRNATANNLRSGLSWYMDAHLFARILDPANIDRAAGVIAAMSPMMSWETNKKAAERAYHYKSADGLGLSRNVAKANQILGGADPLDVLGGNKVRAFFATIVDPQCDADPVIDRHAYDIAVGQVTDDKERGTLSRKGRYHDFGLCYRLAAHVAGISPSQMQAVTWVAWREAKGIV